MNRKFGEECSSADFTGSGMESESWNGNGSRNERFLRRGDRDLGADVDCIEPHGQRSESAPAAGFVGM
jgi:hypothetical protein